MATVPRPFIFRRSFCNGIYELQSYYVLQVTKIVNCLEILLWTWVKTTRKKKDFFNILETIRFTLKSVWKYTLCHLIFFKYRRNELRTYLILTITLRHLHYIIFSYFLSLIFWLLYKIDCENVKRWHCGFHLLLPLLTLLSNNFPAVWHLDLEFIYCWINFSSKYLNIQNKSNVCEFLFVLLSCRWLKIFFSASNYICIKMQATASKYFHSRKKMKQFRFKISKLTRSIRCP